MERQRTLEQAELSRQQQRELGELKREHTLQLGQLERDVAHQQALYAELATNANQAALAKAQQDVEDVRLGAPAMSIDRPLPRGTRLKTILALFVGGLIGLLVAVLREVFVRSDAGMPLPSAQSLQTEQAH